MKLKHLLALASLMIGGGNLCAQTDVTNDYITNADFSSTTGWTNYSGGGSEHNEGSGLIGTLNLNSRPSTTDATHLSTEYCFGFSARWNGRYTYYQQEAQNLPAGAYTLSYDVQDVNSKSTKYNMDNHFYVQVGDTKYSDSATEWMNAGASSWTTHTISFILNETSNVTISFGYGNKENKGSDDCPAIYISHLKLEVYPFATSSDYEALETAISTVEAYTLGFDAGEYAAYNVLPILKTAKAIKSDENNALSTVRGLVDALNAITANAVEVNAIAYGDLSSYETVSGKDYPWGWSKLNDGSRIMGGSEGTNNAGLSASSTGKAMLVKYNANYGRNEDYLMPLKANTYYTLSFKYCGWQNTPDTRVVIKDSESQALTFTPSSFTPATNDGYSNAAHWYEYKATFKTNDAGNYSIELNKVQSGQQQIAWADMNLVRATASEIKSLLNSEIVAANATYNSGANVGKGVFQIPASAGETFNTAIGTAQGVYDKNDATVNEITNAIGALEAAISTFNATELNAPDEDDAFNLYLADGLNKTVTFKAGNATSGGYAIGYTDDAGSFYNQAVHFKSTGTKNQYKLYIIDDADTKHYLCTGTVYEGDKNQIRVTDNEENALAVEVIATAEAGVYNLKNTVADALIGSNGDTGVYTAQAYKNFNINAAETVSVTVSCKAGKYGTVIFPFTPDVSTGFDGITFYTIESVNDATGNVQLTEVAVPEANVPYLIKNDGTEDLSQQLTGWGTATADSYTKGLLTGVYTSANINGDNRYVLQTQDAVQAFYKVNADFNATAYKCYLTYAAPSGVKSFGFEFGGNADAIQSIEATDIHDAKIFNLAGQRMNGLKKGINIVNGKKVLVK